MREVTSFLRWRKVFRFARIYGPRRTLYKVAGRLRAHVPIWRGTTKGADIGLVGCGQFAMATIGYFLLRRFGPRILACYDVDPEAAQSLARFLGVPRVCASVDEVLSTPGLRLLYVASNHASHAQYAARALARGIDVYVEKPIAVTRSQLVELLCAKARSSARVFAGYNRPFSGAVRLLRELSDIDASSGMTLQCFVAGHRLGPDHWYRRAEEGTRVCGNVGHWLDLFIHMLAWRGLPAKLEISITWSDDNEPDDNFSISIATNRGDLFSVMLSSRCEPFEGIYETIHYQHGETIAKIDDFRRMTVWQGANVRSYRFWPKDVGHQGAIYQPFNTSARDWHEIELSTLLMLHVSEMVLRRVKHATFQLNEEWQALESAVQANTRSA